MFRSIQSSLQLWYAGLLAVVLLVFGTTSYVDIQRARYEEIDSELKQLAQLLASGVRPSPPRMFHGDGRPVGFGEGPHDHDRDHGDMAGPGERNRPRGPRMNVATQPGDEESWRPRRAGPFMGTSPANDDERRRPPEPDNPAVRRWPSPEWRKAQPPEVQIPAELARRVGNADASLFYYVVWHVDDTLLTASSPDLKVPLPGPVPPEPSEPEPARIRQRGNLREAYVYGHFDTCCLVGRSIQHEQAAMKQVAIRLGATGVGVLLLGLAGGWLVSSRAVRPIGKMAAAAQQISATSLSRRIDVASEKSELGALAGVLNNTFARLESAFQHQVRFTADASHELRTPLSVIHTHAQLALSRERSAEDYRKTIETCLRASSRMKGLVESLLLLARADGGRLSLTLTNIDLQRIVEDCAELLAPLADEKAVTVEMNLQPARLHADATRIAQVVTNLLSNAIRYNRTGGRVSIGLDVQGEQAILTMTDTGLGIPAESQPHLFERFYRVDTARSREDGGSGLGLAICRTIVETHGGNISFTSEIDVGSVFTVRLPLASVNPSSNGEASDRHRASERTTTENIA